MATTGSTEARTRARQLPVGIQSRRDQLSVLAAVAGGSMAALGSLLTWFTIEIGGVAAPGGSATGLEGRDGRTVLAAAVVSLLAAGLIATGRRRVAAKVTLLAAGAVTAIVAVAGIADATAKDEEVEDEFGIPADNVVADVGPGLWVVAVAGASLVAAGAILEQETSGPQPGRGMASAMSGSTR
jgi:hypothetical protein